MLRCPVLPALIVLGGLLANQPALAQSVPGGRSSSAGSGTSGMGGLSSVSLGQTPSIIGGPPGASVGRTPPRVLNPQALPLRPAGADQPRFESPSQTPILIQKPGTGQPLPKARIEGPPTGITLAEAVQRLVQNNLDLHARFSDISQADADVLTAGLRSNPIVYADSNGVPYGAYRRAAGPLQYDLNVVYPLDLSHKRQARTRSAVAARLVTEASYRDAVRLTVDAAYKAFIDALTAQTIVDVVTRKEKSDLRSQIPVEEPLSVLEDARRSLALLLNIPLAELNGRQLRGQLDYDPDLEPRLPPTVQLVRLSLANRPDLEAQRLAISFAEFNVKAVLASRLDDVLILYQPYTFHDGRQGPGTNNSLAWTLGVTVPLPIYNRQQGNLLKARQIVDQAKIRFASIEQTVISEVEGAVLEHETSHQAYNRTWDDFSKSAYVDPLAPLILTKNLDIDDDLKDKIKEIEARIKALNDDSKYDKLQKYWETVIRHRRSMLRLNTVTGVCVME